MAAPEEIDVASAEDNLDVDLDYAANLEGTEEQDEIIKDAPKKEENTETKLFAEGRDVMSIQDMLQLRTQMLEKLGTAQNALYFSHALVSLLLNSTKVDQGPASGSSAARAGSPGSVSAGAGLRGAETAASTSALQRSVNNVMGSPANLEAEIGIEPHIFGASRLEADRKTIEASARNEKKTNQTTGAYDDDDDIDGIENLDKEMQRSRIQDEATSESERREKLESLVTCLQSKKQGLDRATNILRKGATALRGNETRNRSEKFRWQTLSQAREAGWGLVADKPVRGASKQRRDLLEDGNRKRDEAARDAWIGYAVPEAQISYRKKSLAYVHHDSMSNLSESTGENLGFVARSSKVLQVEMISQEERWISKDTFIEPTTVNEHLSLAQLEMFDAEVFDAILVECRSIAAGSSLFSATINGEDSISIWLGNVELKISLSKRESSGAELKEEPLCHSSSFASVILALLRLGLLRRYRSRSGNLEIFNVPLKNKTSESTNLPILLPVIGPIHYASFVAQLREVLERVKKANAKADYEMHELEKLQSVSQWLHILLQGDNDTQTIAAVEDLGGSASVLLKGLPFAFLTVSYPSDVSLSLPRKDNAMGSKGIYLSKVDLATLQSLLLSEVTQEAQRRGHIASVE